MINPRLYPMSSAHQPVMKGINQLGNTSWPSESLRLSLKIRMAICRWLKATGAIAPKPLRRSSGKMATNTCRYSKIQTDPKLTLTRDWLIRQWLSRWDITWAKPDGDPSGDRAFPRRPRVLRDPDAPTFRAGVIAPGDHRATRTGGVWEDRSSEDLRPATPRQIADQQLDLSVEVPRQASGQERDCGTVRRGVGDGFRPQGLQSDSRRTL